MFEYCRTLLSTGYKIMVSTMALQAKFVNTDGSTVNLKGVFTLKKIMFLSTVSLTPTVFSFKENKLYLMEFHVKINQLITG
jgi:hypothetical protein